MIKSNIKTSEKIKNKNINQKKNKMYIPPCPACMAVNSLIYNIITDDWICKNCGYTIYGGYFDDEE